MMPSSCKNLRERLDELGVFEHQALAEGWAPYRHHLAQCEDCRDFVELLQLTQTAVHRAEPDPFLVRRAAVARSSCYPPPPQPNSVWRWGVLVSLPMAAVAAVVAMMLWVDTPEDTQPITAVIAASPEVASLPNNAPPKIEMAARFTKPTIEITKDGRRKVPIRRGSTVWLSKDARVRVNRAERTPSHFRLDHGVVVAQIGAYKSEAPFIMELKHGTVTSRDAVFTSEVNGAQESVRVLAGAVEVRTADHPGGVILEAGNAMLINGRVSPLELAQRLERDHCLMESCDGTEVSIAAESRPRQVLVHRSAQSNTVVSLVEQATNHRKAKRFEEAAQVYRQLINRFPTSDGALNARVALGQIELDILGHTGDGLKRFEDYLALAPNGPLAKTSRVHLIRALSRTGQYSRVLKETEAYLNNYPKSAFSREILYYKADAFSKLNNCSRAVRLYQRIIERWPDSKAAKKAQESKRACGISI